MKKFSTLLHADRARPDSGHTWGWPQAGGFIGPTLLGKLSTAGGDYHVAMLVLGAMDLASALMFLGARPCALLHRLCLRGPPMLPESWPARQTARHA